MIQLNKNDDRFKEVFNQFDTVYMNFGVYD